MHTDVAIIGGGPAGLQAALTLGRVHRRAVLLDDGAYRNATVPHMHNVLGHDGRPPAEFRAAGRAELAAYDSIEVRAERVSSIEPGPEGFELTLARSGTLTADAVVLATGVRDTLPPVDGLESLWGDLVAQCPFCHGHEFSGQRIGILGSAAASHVSMLLGPIASQVVVFADGDALPEGLAAEVEVVAASVTAAERHQGGVLVTTAEGRHQVAALFVTPVLSQSAPFAEQLGLTLNESGCVRIDEFGRTSLPGVFAAGDLAHLPAYPMPMASVIGSTAAGQMAAVGAQAALMQR